MTTPVRMRIDRVFLIVVVPLAAAVAVTVLSRSVRINREELAARPAPTDERIRQAYMIACANVCWLIMVLGIVALPLAKPISARLGRTVIGVVTRIMVIILMAVSVEMIVDGVVHVVDENYPQLKGAR